jgi:SAM-dependent methyltransferase
MSGFSVDWLRQREPFDTTARAEAAEQLQLSTWLAELKPMAAPWQVVDLGCGTGANLRALAPLLGGPQQWRVVDHDGVLLDRWPPSLHGPGFDARIERRQLDLARHLETLPFEGTTLVTASALLDLVSAEWLQRLVKLCHGVGASVLFALSVDGRAVWDPLDPDDALTSTLFNAHQRRDKGFGPALGPMAAATAIESFRAAGYAVQSAPSDWWIDGRVDAAALGLQRALIDGMAHAAIEQDLQAATVLRAWQTRRHAAAARSTLRIGHLDVIATPRVIKT